MPAGSEILFDKVFVRTPDGREQELKLSDLIPENKLEECLSMYEFVKVTKCKDCKHYIKRTESTGICAWHQQSGYVLAVAWNDYCSMANQD